MEETGTLSLPLDEFDVLSFASNYYIVKKSLLYARLAVLYKRIIAEEVEPRKRIDRFENEFLDFVSDKEAAMYAEQISKDGIKKTTLDILFEVRQNIAFKGNNVLVLIYRRGIKLAGKPVL